MPKEDKYATPGPRSNGPNPNTPLSVVETSIRAAGPWLDTLYTYAVRVFR